MTIIKKRGSLT